MPSEADIAELHRRNIPIFIYQERGTTVTVPPEWRAAILEGR
jgi:hypothetical protein